MIIESANMRLPISDQQQLWSCFAPFLKYGNLLAEKRQLPLPPHSFNTLARGEPLEFLDEYYTAKNSVLGYASVKIS